MRDRVLRSCSHAARPSFNRHVPATNVIKPDPCKWKRAVSTPPSESFRVRAKTMGVVGPSISSAQILSCNGFCSIIRTRKKPLICEGLRAENRRVRKLKHESDWSIQEFDSGSGWSCRRYANMRQGRISALSTEVGGYDSQHCVHRSPAASANCRIHGCRGSLKQTWGCAKSSEFRGLMKNVMGWIWSSKEGQSIAEYAVILAVILILVVGTIRLVGSNANNTFSQVSSSMNQ